MALKLSMRGRVDPFIALDVLRMANERAMAGGEVLHLEIGQPGGGAPHAVIEAAKRALDLHSIGYTEALGLPELRRRVALHYRERYGVDLDWRRVAITGGSSAAFLLSFMAAFDAGDRVALASPSYPAYRNILSSIGVVPVDLPARQEDRFQPTPVLLDRETSRLDGLIVAHPSNPTGAMLSAQELKSLCQYCRDRGVRVISDEIYHGIVYGHEPATALTFENEAIIINSFSKYYSMTGWRLGWAVLPEALVRPVECLAQSLFISPPTLSQLAALAAFEARTELDARVALYRRNRDLLIRRLPEAGIDRFLPPEGAFYLYADMSNISNDSEALCLRLLAETGVALTPGTDFDRNRGHSTVRISFAGPEPVIAEALDRLKAWRVAS
ncbi:MAG TPA: aminotransferase class I/II-fold pyridoxal phosphate-dependent enzyme [Alphaproteobacteria bacterium]|nr:aminotransferase class I/II-fold pyridoxal phosphate-dependent enzyme [Alphaproteobacteria bacterium]